MDADEAFVKLHERVEDWPLTMEEGDAVNEIVGLTADAASSSAT